MPEEEEIDVAEGEEGDYEEDQVFLRNRGEAPTLWVQGGKDYTRPVLEYYGEPMSLLTTAARAIEIGLNVEYASYNAPVGRVESGDTLDEAHLVIWKRVESDASLQAHKWWPDDEQLKALLQVAGAARTFRMDEGVGSEALLSAVARLDETQLP